MMTQFAPAKIQTAIPSSSDHEAEPLCRKFGVVEGIVSHGQKLGRTLGYPTANIAIRHERGFRFGVYATRSRLQDGRWRDGVANIGCNPTTGLVLPRLEVFLFEFDEDIYDQALRTELVAHIRPELKFESLEALVEQIGQDVVEAKRLLEKLPPATAASQLCPIGRKRR